MPKYQWRVLRYKRLKQDDDSVQNEVSLIIDTSLRQLSVLCQQIERERVQFSGDEQQYPKIRIDGSNLYILYNSKFEGFRVTFWEEDKREISDCVSEFGKKPESSPAVAPDARIRSFSQPVRNFQNLQHQFSCPYPRNDFSSPVDSLPSVGEFRDTGFSTPSLPTFSQNPPFTDSPPKIDASVQTDDLMDEMMENPEFVALCLRNLMQNDQFGQLVKSTRHELRNMSEDERNVVFKLPADYSEEFNDILILPDSQSSSDTDAQICESQFDDFFEDGKL
uniref:Uncharacterized protein n=1 Tax=Caenorhabditis japonica TaxID=281687 RepID=A0A8R1DKR0_CAEJA